MNVISGDMAAVLDQQISGFHQYSLQHPVHLTYVSSNLCSMFGCSKEELLNEYADLYGQFVYPEDRSIYDAVLKKLTAQMQTVTVQYRIVLKDGGVRYVNDTLTSFRRDDGTISASSVLTDITEIKAESDSLSYINDTLSCGFVRFTCEKNPKVTYFNEEMLRILRFPENDRDHLDMYKESVFMMIPPEQRRKFAVFLKRVYTQNTSVSGELAVQRCDGTRARIQGWVTKCINSQGEEEFQTVCIDITEKYQNDKERKIDSYLKALTDVYDRIFEYDFSRKTVKCIHAVNSNTFGRIVNIPMHMEDATEHYLQQAVVEEDRDKVREYFCSLYRLDLREADGEPPQIQFRALSSKGTEQICSGIFIRLESSVGLLCCRTVDIIGQAAVGAGYDMQGQASAAERFTEGNIAFEVKNGMVKPRYSSDNICRFFGYSADEWDRMAVDGVSIRSFVSRSGVPYEEFMRILDAGEAEFSYMDVASGTMQRIKAVCSDVFAEGSVSKYVMLYRVPDAGSGIVQQMPAEAVNQTVTDKPDTSEKSRVQIRTFGYFDVFIDGTPVSFRNKKSKELLALLVDRRGGYVTSEQAISCLWEDEPVNSVTKARYRKVAMRLKNILEEYGIADIVESVDGNRRLVRDKVRCDLYDYLSHKEEFVHLFKGSYLSDYSWGENTLGELYSDSI